MNNIISIIIPTYNRARTLPQAVQSVIQQSATNWELIIVDDGSTDDTTKVLEEYLLDERVKYHFQENAGVSTARNKGVELSRGDYTIFLDSDDQFYPDLIFELNKVNYTEYDLVCWQVLKIIDSKKHIWKAQKLGGMYNYLTVTFFPGSICYKKKLFLAVGGYDPKMTFGENYELGIRISDLPRVKILVLDQIFLKYNMDTSKRTSNSLKNRLNSHLHQYEKHLLKYNQNKGAKAEMNYIIGYVFEKMDKKSVALGYYSAAFKNNPWRLKHILKYFYFKIFG